MEQFIILQINASHGTSLALSVDHHSQLLLSHILENTSQNILSHNTFSAQCFLGWKLLFFCLSQLLDTTLFWLTFVSKDVSAQAS